MEDYNRTHLVTVFACAKCGTALNITYDKPKETNCSAREFPVNDGITGALKVENRIGVHPCKKCSREMQEPIAALKKLLECVALVK